MKLSRLLAPEQCRTLVRCVAPVGLVIGLVSCAGSGIRSRTGCEDCNARVTRSLPSRVTAVDVATDGGCPRTVTVPSDSAHLSLVRSLPNGRADYALAVGQYGAREGELLRIHCVDGTVAGLAPR